MDLGFTHGFVHDLAGHLDVNRIEGPGAPMRLLTRFTLLWLGLAASSCGARFQALDPHESTSNPELDHGLRFTRETHGHRDFPRPFEVVWDATVEGLHAGGIAVPASAVPEDQDGVIDVERVWVRVTERADGRTCVMVRFADLEEGPGRRDATVLLDEVQRRLR